MDEVGCCADRNRAGAYVGVRALGLYPRDFRAVLSAIRVDDRRRYDHLAARFADAVAGAVRAAAEAAREAPEAALVGRADPRLFPIFNRYFAALTRGYGWLSGKVVRIAVLMLVVYAGVIAFGLNEFRKTPRRLHPAARPRLPHHCDAVAAGGLARPHRRRQPPGRGARAQGPRRRPCGQHRRLFRRHLHQRAQRRRGFRHPRRFREARRGPAPIGRRDPGRAVQASRVHPGCLDLCRRAAAGLRHRQCRRFPHDGGGPRRPRLRGAARLRPTP